MLWRSARIPLAWDLMVALLAFAAAPAVGAFASDKPALSVRVDFQNVNMHVAAGVVLEVHRLQGRLTSTRAGQPPTFDDVRSYRLQIDRAEVAMSASSLEALLNRQLFSGRDSSLADVDVTIEHGGLKQSGKLRTGIPIPFSTFGVVSVTADGRIRMHPTSIRAAGVPAGGVAEAAASPP